MARDRQGGRLGGLRYKTVHGEATQMAGKRLTPVARVLSFGRARGTVGTNRLGGWVGAFAWVTPVAVIVDSEEGEHRLAIGDATRRALLRICGLGLLLTLALVTARWLARCVDRNPS